MRKIKKVAAVKRGLCLTYQRLGRYDQARADLTAAIELDPKDAWAYAARGSVLVQAGRFAEARKDFAAALRIDHSVIPPFLGGFDCKTHAAICSFNF